MRILVFQHLRIEHPGMFRDIWNEDGHECTTIELDEGETIPELEAFDLLVVMGGPMDTWDETNHPWLRPEKTAIRRWAVELERPCLGICLGHQLLADALGGTIGPMPAPEVGLDTVTLSAAGQADPVLGAIGPAFEAMHWHGAEVRTLPEGAISLATTPACACQAMRWGRHAYGLQFHIEVTADMVQAWAAIPDYRKSLEAARGAEVAVARVVEEVAAASDVSRAIAGRVSEAVLALAGPLR